MAAVIDVEGQRFGRLIAISRGGTRHGQVLWRCACDCGRSALVLGYLLRKGLTRSCGCLSKENSSNVGRSNRRVRVAVDLSGLRFGHLTVLGESGKTENGINWNCQRSCGKKVIVRASYLRSGDTKSCGHLRGTSSGCFQPLPLEGRRFGRLVVVCREKRGGMTGWRCRCDCGQIRVVDANRLTSGRTQSCGCLWRDWIKKKTLPNEERSARRHESAIKSRVGKVVGLTPGDVPQDWLAAKRAQLRLAQLLKEIRNGKR